jgi:rsbT antagonist protein RsbS
MSIPGLHLTQIGKEDFLLEPSRGLDVSEHDRLIESIIEPLLGACASRLYYDLSTQAIIDPVYYNWLNKLARTALAINVKMVCVQMQPTAAFALVQFTHEKPAFETALDISGWQSSHSLTPRQAKR